jgi:hypothetical protein
MESCPRFEYLFLATYLSLPTTRPFLGPAVYAPTRRTSLSLAGPTRISPPSVSPVPAFRPAIRCLPLGIYTYFYLHHCRSYHRKANPQPFLSHCQPLHITQRDLWPNGVIAIWPLQKTLLSTTSLAPSWINLFRLYRCGNSPNAFASHYATAHITNRKLSYIGVWEVETPNPPENASGPLAIVTRGLLPPHPRFSASTDPVFFHVTATSNSGIWNSTILEIFKNKTTVVFGIQSPRKNSKTKTKKTNSRFQST